jgi:ankyrin repeat protein
VLDDEWAFVAACFHFDLQAAQAQIERHPEYLHSHQAMFAAAKRDRGDVVEFLLDLGVPIEVHDKNNARTLHQAAAHNALRVASLLIDRGAEIDPRDSTWDSPPIGWAAHGDKVEMIELLSRFSRNVWRLAFRGYVGRLREVLATEPELAKLVSDDGITPLWWLPDDEAKALEIVELLLSCGANPSIRSKGEKTAADWALKRGMREVAARLTAAATETGS